MDDAKSRFRARNRLKVELLVGEDTFGVASLNLEMDTRK